VDLALFLLGQPRPLRVHAATYRHFTAQHRSPPGQALPGPDDQSIDALPEDTLFAQIEFDAGCTFTLRDMGEAHLNQGHVMHWPFGEFDVFGTAGSASLHPLQFRQRRPDGTVRTEQPDVDNDIGTSHGPAYRDLFRRIREHPEAVAPEHHRDAERAVAVWELLEALRDSANASPPASRSRST
jgi:predicted dehydrogenase